jgi:NAD+ synthase (glutamine-hydrolysing)
LPNYSVFDEARVFVPGESELILNLGGVSTGFLICEDLWRFEGPVAALAEHELDAVVVINASPFDTEKDEHRYPLLKKRAAELKTTMLYVNLFGGQDDLVFDGDSCVISKTGEVLANAQRFERETLMFDITGSATSKVDVALNQPKDELKPKTASSLNDLEEIWLALTIGIRDFVNKNGFKSVVLGVSGGIDSAVCASLAVDAIGAERVYGIAMPSEYSSDHSLKDAAQLCENIGANYSVQKINCFVEPIETGLGLSGVSAENLQARIRGLILMAKSNQAGHLVLTTGNKTEISVGYCTMYGDTVGGFAPLKDVPKTLVWKLAEWRNRFAAERGETPPIPENSITKPPSAELRPGQLDQDSLPPYEELDQILEKLIDQRIPVSEIVASGFAEETVKRIVDLVTGSEWKRRQGAIGPRITRMAFGRERRLPITVKRSKG